MKWSLYNFIIRNDSNYLLYNSLTNELMACVGAINSLLNEGIKEQMNTITNSYNKWLYLFHILVAKITRKTEITKKGVWLCSLFSLVPIYLPSYF